MTFRGLVREGSGGMVALTSFSHMGTALIGNVLAVTATTRAREDRTQTCSTPHTRQKRQTSMVVARENKHEVCWIGLDWIGKYMMQADVEGGHYLL